jgi:hypothetical protein
MLRRGNTRRRKGPHSISAIFPNLEGIEVLLNSSGTPVPESEHPSTLYSFEAFVAARQQAGRPVNVYCDTDQVRPAPFYDVRGWPEY